MKKQGNILNWVLVILGVSLLWLSQFLLLSDLFISGEGINIFEKKIYLAVSLISTPVHICVVFGVVGLVFGLATRHWSLLAGLGIALLLYFPAVFVANLFRLSVMADLNEEFAWLSLIMFVIPAIALIAMGFCLKPEDKDVPTTASTVTSKGAHSDG